MNMVNMNTIKLFNNWICSLCVCMCVSVCVFQLLLHLPNLTINILANSCKKSAFNWKPRIEKTESELRCSCDEKLQKTVAGNTV